MKMLQPKPKQRYALTLLRQESLLNSSTQLHNGSGITSPHLRRRGRLAAWLHNIAIVMTLFGLAMVLYA